MFETSDQTRGVLWARDFLTQMTANALGTVIGGLLLGSVALRVGVIRIDRDAANLAAGYSLALSVMLASLFVLALVTVFLLNLIEPSQRPRRWRMFLTGTQIALLGGIGLSVAFHGALLLFDWDVEQFIVLFLQVTVQLCLILVTRAAARRCTPRTAPDASTDRPS